MTDTRSASPDRARGWALVRSLAIVALCAPALAACGTSESATSDSATPDIATSDTAVVAEVPPAASGDSSSPDTGGAASSCLVGTTDCVDTVTGPFAGSGGVVSGADGSVPIDQAVRAGIDGPFLISGFVLGGPEGTRVCATLLESMPPQCGAPSLRVDLGSRAADLLAPGAPTTQAAITWTTRTITLEGSIVGDSFVLSAP